MFARATQSPAVIRRRTGEPDIFTKTGQPVRREQTPAPVAQTAPNRAERERAAAEIRDLRTGSGQRVAGGSSVVRGGPFGSSR